MSSVPLTDSVPAKRRYKVIRPVDLPRYVDHPVSVNRLDYIVRSQEVLTDQQIVAVLLLHFASPHRQHAVPGKPLVIRHRPLQSEVSLPAAEAKPAGPAGLIRVQRDAGSEIGGSPLVSGMA